MTVYEYAVDPRTEKVHLALLTETAWGDYGKTLCGRSLEPLLWGDETLSGGEATCGSCRRLADVKGENPGAGSGALR